MDNTHAATAQLNILDYFRPALDKSCAFKIGTMTAVERVNNSECYAAVSLN